MGNMLVCLWEPQLDRMDSQGMGEGNKLWSKQSCNQHTFLQACVSGPLLGTGNTNVSKNATICADLLHARVYKDDPWWVGGVPVGSGDRDHLGVVRDPWWEDDNVATANPFCLVSFVSEAHVTCI